MKTTAAWFHVLYFSPGWMSDTMAKCFTCLPRLSKGSLIPEETLIKHTYSYLHRSLKQQNKGKTFLYEVLILQNHACSAFLIGVDLLTLKSLFTSLNQGCPQLMRQEVTSRTDEDVCSLTYRGFMFLQLHSGLKRVLPVILEKKSSAHSPQNTLEILDIIF